MVDSNREVFNPDWKEVNQKRRRQRERNGYDYE
jgi:hypothetical protein